MLNDGYQKQSRSDGEAERVPGDRRSPQHRADGADHRRLLPEHQLPQATGDHRLPIDIQVLLILIPN